MEKTTRRRRVTAREKKGAHKSYDSEPGEGSRRKHRTKSNARTGRSERPAYRNMERSMHEDRTWDDRDHDHDEENILSRRWRSNRRRYKTRDRDQSPVNRRHRVRDEEKETRKPRHEEKYRTRRHRRGPSVRNEDLIESYHNGDRVLYGEHPASGGPREYFGTNKRHQGLLGNPERSRSVDQRYGKNEEGLMRKLDEERLYRIGRKKRPRNHKTSTRLAISDYEHRKQFGTPFHAMQMYDPIKSEYEREEMDEFDGDDHIYRYGGYQRSGNTEGFGDRQGGRQQGHDWVDEDEYREGHAPRYRGYGKYGSR